MNKETIKKVETVPMNQDSRYEVLIEETRKDEAGNDYKFTRKIFTSVVEVDQQIKNIETQLKTLEAEKATLTARKAKLI